MLGALDTPRQTLTRLAARRVFLLELANSRPQFFEGLSQIAIVDWPYPTSATPTFDEAAPDVLVEDPGEDVLLILGDQRTQIRIPKMIVEWACRWNVSAPWVLKYAVNWHVCVRMLIEGDHQEGPVLLSSWLDLADLARSRILHRVGFVEEIDVNLSRQQQWEAFMNYRDFRRASIERPVDLVREYDLGLTPQQQREALRDAIFRQWWDGIDFLETANKVLLVFTRDLVGRRMLMRQLGEEAWQAFAKMSDANPDPTRETLREYLKRAKNAYLTKKAQYEAVFPRESRARPRLAEHCRWLIDYQIPKRPGAEKTRRSFYWLAQHHGVSHVGISKNVREVAALIDLPIR